MQQQTAYHELTSIALIVYIFSNRHRVSFDKWRNINAVPVNELAYLKSDEARVELALYIFLYELYLFAPKVRSVAALDDESVSFHLFHWLDDDNADSMSKMRSAK